ncbi:nucleotide pyrophosphohydrolase [Candidatus Microgenomates bacterium]|nr:MAG: nucleotide pyrophosphohydrolase [Candidatus Microgenomates bacterium]
MTDLKTLQQKIIDFRNARKWRKFHNPKDGAISIVLEVAELIEHFQWKSEDDIKKYLEDPKNKEAIGDELSDVLYWILVMAHDFDIDLGVAFAKKMKKNEKKYPVKK